MARVHIRPLALIESELDAVVRLWHETKRDTYHFLPQEQGRSLEDDRAFFENGILARCRIWVALVEGEVLGFLAMAGSYVDRLYVRPDAQRRGIGAALLAKAREVSPEGLELHTHQKNQKACAFYEKHGLKAARYGVSPPPESEPDVEYRWRPAR
jgi:GNAT superfamily N-acetyltransferase